jgi:hypothetical protein
MVAGRTCLLYATARGGSAALSTMPGPAPGQHRLQTKHRKESCSTCSALLVVSLAKIGSRSEDSLRLPPRALLCDRLPRPVELRLQRFDLATSERLYAKWFEAQVNSCDT